MAKKAIISVFSGENENNDEPISVTTPGEFYKRNDCYYAVYKETEISGMEGTTTTLKIKPDKFSILRMGTTSTKMEFQKDKKTFSLYDTPYGTLELEINTKQLQIDINDEGGKVSVKYELNISKQSKQLTNLQIEIKVI
ncbi:MULTISPECIES: DUF1934 domain-containing protein [Clostridium]|uniref:DUF1934 domain-containing protein n=1 Tax=Clostridium TaxID=1485 RepID=UPI00069F5AEF|nr:MULTISPECIES: DUF1934 domain-containing protein [Clostridium]KOF56661.1 hypothetical protein AGR56_08005 [Clostridium sp. DMHC 10]MCD2346719.1 DUF1934 domain-containing protein [Clostridium guangxiense]